MAEPTPLPIACSLSAVDAEQRGEAWRRLAREALTGRDPNDGRVLLRFRGSPEIRRELAGLIAAEGECCPFLSFALDEAGGEIALAISGPPEAEPILASFAVSAAAR